MALLLEHRSSQLLQYLNSQIGWDVRDLCHRVSLLSNRVSAIQTNWLAYVLRGALFTFRGRYFAPASI